MPFDSIDHMELAKASDDELLWLHKKVHQAANLDRDNLTESHLLVVQELARRQIEHKAEDAFDEETATFASTALNLNDGEIEVLQLATQKAAVPPASASNEEKREAQKKRAKQFGIEALEDKGERLTFPKDGPTKLSEYGDPVNLKFFLDTVARARNARVRFKQFADTYSKQKSKAVVHERIVRAELKHGIKPSFDEDDPLDKLLPKDLKDKLKEKTAKVCESSCSSCGVCSCAKDKEQEDHIVRLLPVEKGDNEHQIVFGIVLEPNEVDTQKDTIKKLAVIAKTAHKWLAQFQDRGLQHKKIVNSKIEIYESYIAPVAFKVGKEKVKKGSWLLMYHILDDQLWKDIKSGKYTGFSIGGFARRNKI